MDQHTAHAALQDVNLTPADARDAAQFLDAVWREKAKTDTAGIYAMTAEAELLFRVHSLLCQLADEADPQPEDLT